MPGKVIWYSIQGGREVPARRNW